MKEPGTTTEPAVQSLAQSAGWYLATTLSERLALFRERLSQPAVGRTSGEAERAEQRLKQWKSQPPFHKFPQSFIQRLEADGLTEDTFFALLAIPAEELQAAHTTPPAWLEDFISALTSRESHARFAPIARKLEDSQNLAFLRPLRAWLERAFGRLQSGIQELQSIYPHLPFDPQTIEILLFSRLLALLRVQVTKVMVLELNVARVQGELQGETPEQRFDFFFQQFTRPEKVLALFEEYPMLARQVVEITNCWLACELELLQRLCADWDEICRVFSPEGDPGVLTQVLEGAGDTHDGGHSVATLTWSSGLRLVYKPRSQMIDALHQELLTWLNSLGCQPPFRTFKLIHKDSYGWCEFIADAPCNSSEQIERFYQRLGGHMALLYVLEATDFHAQNLIAAGEDPMLIDLEALLHPRFSTGDEPIDLADDMLDHSVLRIGLLPQRMWANQENAGVDLSGLTAANGQLTPDRIAQLKEKGTDQMRIAKEYIELEQGNHRPKLQEQEVDVVAYSKSIITGFTTIYRLLLEQRETFQKRFLPRFASTEVRVLPRATRLYASLLVDSAHPNVLRDALELERLFDRLWIGVGLQPYLARIIPAERADLLRGDIPKFIAHPDSRDLFTSRGEAISEFFEEASLDAAKKCTQRLSEDDLERQIWIIEASFTSLTLDTHLTKKNALRLRPVDSPVSRDRLLDEARAIGNRLQRLALIDGERINWPGVIEINGQGWNLLPAGPDLYNGLAGIALFLAYLGQVSGEEQHTRLARLTWQAINNQFAREQRYLQWGMTGAFNGVGSFLYLLSHLGTLWHDPALYQQAEEMAANLSELINADQTFDIVGGAAGCLAALLSLYAVAPSMATLRTAVQCGDHLLKHARPMPVGIGWSSQSAEVPLTGMAHGNAGIALNLFRLAAVSQEKRFREGALAAMAYERSMFLPEKGNWADLRGVTSLEDASDPQALSTTGRAPMVAWCHGAAGIGLARLGSLQYQDDAAIRAEIDAAVQTTRAQGFGTSHSLCHGDMGNLETLLIATRLLPEQYPAEIVTLLQSSLVESMERQGWRSCVPLGIETPGLMHGLAGTGYTLLRLVEPEQVPSVLLLAAPSETSR